MRLKECLEADEHFGAFYRPEKTVFRAWAPVADEVCVCLYHRGTDAEMWAQSGAEADGEKSAPFRCMQMQKKSASVYECTIEGNLDGVFYTYRITREGSTKECVDPYAKACDANGQHGMIVDLKKTNPRGWKADAGWTQRNENTVIYELHVKDFSFAEESGISEKHRGKFLAFTEQGKTFRLEKAAGVTKNGNTCTTPEGRRQTTGISYLKELGITHVHLLPLFDYATVDETGDGQDFNWGYDPANYNVPEGSYSTNPYDGHVRIRECKEMIQALHRAGIGAIMDVVYNHTYASDGAFQVMAPFYYYRQNEDGSLSNGSGCGNETASERAMVGSFIRQSVLYWAEEYHIDGFRFDLMGLHDTETMNGIRKALREKFPKKSILLYGEPWTGGASPMSEGFFPAVKANVHRLDESIAIFNDSTRDTIKGSVFYGESPGFVNGRAGLEKEIVSSFLAWCDGGHDFAPQSPAQSINYVSVHDNYTLWDKLVLTAGMQAYDKKEEVLLRQNKLAAGIVLSCMGTPLFQAGEEFGRTKHGDENSYRSAPQVNCLDWKRRAEFADLVEYYRGLIALRGQIAFFRDKTMEALSHVRILQAEGGMVSLLVDNASYGRQKWKHLIFAFYAGVTDTTMALPKGQWQVLADRESSLLWKQNGLLRKKYMAEKEIRLEAVSLCILGSTAE